MNQEAIDSMRAEHVQRLLRIEEKVDALIAERDALQSNLDWAIEMLAVRRKERDALAAENKVLQEALLNIARKAEALKKECGADPESPQAIRNGRYMHLVYLAHAALTKEAAK